MKETGAKINLTKASSVKVKDLETAHDSTALGGFQQLHIRPDTAGLTYELCVTSYDGKAATVAIARDMVKDGVTVSADGMQLDNGDGVITAAEAITVIEIHCPLSTLRSDAGGRVSGTDATGHPLSFYLYEVVYVHHKGANVVFGVVNLEDVSMIGG